MASAVRIPRCRACNGRLTCMSCAGSKGGRTVTPKRLAAMRKALACRFRWLPGDKVQPRLKRDRSWLAEVVRVGAGARGLRGITVRVYWSDDQPANFEALVAESLLARVRP